jgi:2'-5' RNA ligase
MVPHITLARARVPLASAVRAKLAEAVAGAFPGPKATVGQYVLMESDLSRGGATYRAVARFDL